MILLRKPYKPIVYTSEIKTFNVYGKSFRNVTAVYLSGTPYSNQTFYNPFSALPKLSAQYPGFYGVKLLPSDYQSNNTNTITFTMPSASRAGFVDVVVENPAGYGTLTQYVVKYLFPPESLTQEELRPWCFGIEVKSTDQIYSIDGDILVTIAEEDNIITMGDADSPVVPIPPETFFIITNDNEILITGTGDRIIYGT